MKRLRHNRGHLWRTSAGTWQAEVCHAYEKKRMRHPTEIHARAWIDTVCLDIDRQERPLSPAEYADAKAALAILPTGLTLVEAARSYARQAAPMQSVTLRHASEAIIEDRRAAGRREQTIAGLRHRLRRLCETFGDRLVMDITTAELRAWLATEAPRVTSRRNYRREFHTLFSFAQAMGWTTSNPVAAITVPRVDPAQPGILTVAQARALLESAATRDAALVAYVAVGLFAGVRRAELVKLTASDFHADHIMIGATVAKTRRQRHVTVCPPLTAWLERFPWPADIDNLRKRFDVVKADISPWPQNALRHSWATYHLALHKNAALTAHELGHSGADLLYRHYRGLATYEQAVAYFALVPNTVLEKSRCLRLAE